MPDAMIARGPAHWPKLALAALVALAGCGEASVRRHFLVGWPNYATTTILITERPLSGLSGCSLWDVQPQTTDPTTWFILRLPDGRFVEAFDQGAYAMDATARMVMSACTSPATPPATLAALIAAFAFRGRVTGEVIAEPSPPETTSFRFQVHSGLPIDPGGVKLYDVRVTFAGDDIHIDQRRTPTE